jgi:hypothetical protein
MLGSMNQEKLQSIIKAALIMFIFMKFMDQITGFAKALVGGAELKSDWNASASGMAKNAYGTLRGIQQRGMRVAKAGANGIMRAGGQAKSMIGSMGNKGKATNVPDQASGNDHQPTAQGATADGSDHVPRDSQLPVDRLGEENSGNDNANEVPDEIEDNQEEGQTASAGEGEDNVVTKDSGEDSGGVANGSADNAPTNKASTDAVPLMPPPPPSVGGATNGSADNTSIDSVPTALPSPPPVHEKKAEQLPTEVKEGGSSSTSTPTTTSSLPPKASQLEQVVEHGRGVSKSTPPKLPFTKEREKGDYMKPTRASEIRKEETEEKFRVRAKREEKKGGPLNRKKSKKVVLRPPSPPPSFK